MGSFWELLGVSWRLFGGFTSTTEGFQIPLETLLGLVCSLLAASCSFMFVILSSMSSFIFFRGLLGSILSSQADPPTLKNLDFPNEILTFMKKQRFRAKDGFESVWGLPWAPFGSSWGSLGGSSGTLHRPKRASRFDLELPWASFACFLLLKMALSTFWGRLGLVFGAPSGLSVGVFVPVGPILTFKTDFPSVHTFLFCY